MANRFIGINNTGIRDNGDANWTLGSSTGSTDVELRIDDTKNWSRKELAAVVRGMADFIEVGSAGYPNL